MHIFIAGVMQGNRTDHLIDAQDYRAQIAVALERHLPQATITDPYFSNPDSVEYSLEQARHTFHANTALAGQADLLIAYLPTASMGTAIEMWTAHLEGAYIIAVTPLAHNWVVRLTADEVLPDLPSLLEAIESGRLAHLSDRFRRPA
jgi:hypothetical protein